MRADVSENRLPETKNNFSDYDISEPTPSVSLSVPSCSLGSGSIAPQISRCEWSWKLFLGISLFIYTENCCLTLSRGFYFRNRLCLLNCCCYSLIAEAHETSLMSFC